METIGTNRNLDCKRERNESHAQTESLLELGRSPLSVLGVGPGDTGMSLIPKGSGCKV